MEVKNFLKNDKQPFIQQRNFKPPYCPSSKRNKWLEFDKDYYCQNCECIINKQKHQIDKKVRRQYLYFSTRLPYANIKMREVWMNMTNTTYKSSGDVNNKLQN